MIINLAKLLAAKQAEASLSNDALAKAIGVSIISLKGVLAGKSKPNATTAKKYAAYLGIDVTELTAAKKPMKAAKKTKTVTKTATKAKIVKATKRTPSSKTGSLGTELVNTVRAASNFLDDDLAFAVHRAGKDTRNLIAVLLKVG